MTHRRWFIFTLIFCACVSSPLQAQSSSEAKFISKVSQKRLQQTVRDLVKCGNRLGGTKSGDKAALFVFNKFKSYGFKPEMISDPQKLVYSNDSWKLKIEQPKRLSGLIHHEWLAGFSPFTKQDTAHLTFIKSIRDIDEETVRKGAVLLDGHGPGGQPHALRRGAAVSDGPTWWRPWLWPRARTMTSAAPLRERAVANQVSGSGEPAVARALYASVDVGQEIPPHLYRAVAEILAYIFKLMNGRTPG